MGIRLLHVNVNCSDLDRSIKFYTKLGFTVIRDFGEINSPGMGRAFRLGAGHIRVVHLAIGDAPGTMRIDLVEWRDPKPVTPEARPLNALGIGRLCFAVEDINTIIERLRADGIESWTVPETLDDGDKIRTVCFSDPDGTVLQLIEGV